MFDDVFEKRPDYHLAHDGDGHHDCIYRQVRPRLVRYVVQPPDGDCAYDHAKKARSRACVAVILV